MKHDSGSLYGLPRFIEPISSKRGMTPSTHKRAPSDKMFSYIGALPILPFNIFFVYNDEIYKAVVFKLNVV